MEERTSRQRRNEPGRLTRRLSADPNLGCRNTQHSERLPGQQAGVGAVNDAVRAGPLHRQVKCSLRCKCLDVFQAWVLSEQLALMLVTCDVDLRFRQGRILQCD